MSVEKDNNIMPKPRATKRAKSYNDDESDDEDDTAVVNNVLANIDLGEKSTTPKVIANALIDLLPSGATKQHPTSKKLLKAFPLVVSELEQRANRMARKNETQGSSLPIVFQFPSESSSGEMSVINIPEDSFVNVFSFITNKEIVHASIVSKSWLAVSRMPSLWKKLDKSCGLTNSNKSLNATTMIKLLGRPQVSF